jgi:hypothetical protein
VGTLLRSLGDVRRSEALRRDLCGALRASAGGPPTTLPDQKKEDTSNEPRKRTFLKIFDRVRGPSLVRIASGRAMGKRISGGGTE